MITTNNSPHSFTTNPQIHLCTLIVIFGSMATYMIVFMPNQLLVANWYIWLASCGCVAVAVALLPAR